MKFGLIFICVTLGLSASDTEHCGCPGSRASNTDQSGVSDDITSLKPSYDKSYSGVITKMNNKMVMIPGGSGYIGTNKPVILRDGESPKRIVKVSSFQLDKYEVSNNGIFLLY